MPQVYASGNMVVMFKERKLIAKNNWVIVSETLFLSNLAHQYFQ